MYNQEGNSSEPVRIFRADELFSALHYSGETQHTSVCVCVCLYMWYSSNKSLDRASEGMKQPYMCEFVYMTEILLNAAVTGTFLTLFYYLCFCFSLAEKCECKEQALTNSKLFCTMNYAYGKRSSILPYCCEHLRSAFLCFSCHYE